MRLWLLRHAKSSWQDDELPDIERPLAPRGRRAADAIARYIARESIRPELVLCSPAARARETLERVLPSLGDPDVGVEPELYTFDPEPLLLRLRSIPDRVGSVMLVGHNPAIQRLALTIARGGDRRAELAASYPTGALAELELEARTWSDAGVADAALTRFVLPRRLVADERRRP
jgi:phosphohistidine phosphatase